MIEIRALPIESTFVRAVGQADSKWLKDLNMRGHATIETIFGDKNELWLGKPQIFDFISLNKLSGQSIPPQLEMESRSADLLLVQLACSFKPAPECEFVQSTVRVLLQSSSIQSEQPIALDLFPRNVDIPISCKRSLSISPALKITYQQVPQLEASVFNHETSSEYLKYEPEITAFGTGESNPGWEFNKSKARPIRGVKDLFVLIKKSKNTPLEMHFDVSAWVQTSIAKIPLPSFFLSGSDEPLVTEKVIL